MDATDSKILRLLADDARMSWSDLAAKLKLSAPAAAERVRRLEERGFIRGYTARLDAEALGLGVTAFVAVTLERPRHRNNFLRKVLAVDAVLECHHVAGEDDYVLKLRVPDLRSLEQLVSDEIKSVEGVATTRTMIALSTLKETLTPPLDHLDKGRRR